jgi:regulator of protease activity HflC (stomatin/prohibitin superfamily)
MNSLFDWIFDMIENFYCMFVIRPYERGVHIRRGKLKRTVKPGLYFKLPFELDEIHKVNVVSTTTNLETQLVTTDTGEIFAVGAVLRWRVREDACARLVIDLEDYEDVLEDTALGMIAQVFSNKRGKLTLDEVRLEASEAIRRRLGKFGIDLEDLYITDFGKCRAFRLIQSD